MKDDMQPLRPSGQHEKGGASENGETVEYDTGVGRWVRLEASEERNRGYWVDDSGGEAPMGGHSRLEQPPSTGSDAGSSAPTDLNARRRQTRRRRFVRWVVVLLIIAGVTTVAALVLTGRTVVPGLSERVFPIHYQEDIALVAEKYGQDPYLIAAVVKAESGYDPDAVSRVGAVGLMQVMPDTAAWVVAELTLWKGDESPDITDPIDNLELGACYLAYLGDTFGDGTQLALAAYNAGPGAVTEWIEAAGGQEEFDLTDIRFPETRHYVERVEHYRLLYMQIHPDVFGLSKAPYLANATGGTGVGLATATKSGDDPSR